MQTQPSTIDWLPIDGYAGLYAIAPTGTILQVRTGHVKLPSVAGNGYLYVHLWKNNRRKAERLHRLVAKAFIPNPLSLREVNHRDGNKHNCRAENLEWSTRSHNLSHARQNGLRVGAGKAGKLTAEQARTIRNSILDRRELAALFGVSYYTVRAIQRGQRWPYA